MELSRTTVGHLLSVAVAAAAFLLGVQLLGGATGVLAPTLQTIIERAVATDLAALGGSWLAAYLLLNGSVVAAIALSLFGAELLSLSQLLLMLAGSRLGAGGVVVLVGGLDYLRHRRQSVRDAMDLGVLVFLVTYTVYLPATAVAYVSLPWLVGRVPTTRAGPRLVQPLSAFGPLVEWLIVTLGAWLAFLLALGLLVGALSLFDRVVATLDTTALRRRYLAHLERPAVTFVVGVVVTALTTSVAFSLGVVVPPYNRGVLTREEMIPYILGASIGTLADTLLVAVVLGLPTGMLAVATLLVTGTVFSLVALAGYPRYSGAVGYLHDQVLSNRTTFLLFVVGVLAIPMVLLLNDVL